MQEIRNLLPGEIEDRFESAGLPRYRGRQVFKALADGVSKWDEVTVLPKDLRASLKESAPLANIQKVLVQESKIDGTKKYLFRLPAMGGETSPCIESVYMKHDYGGTICISSQAGCRMGCSFCASTLNGLERNLEPWEMAEQVRIVAQDNGVEHPRIVVMGMGEPFDNYDNLKRFLEIVTHPQGMGIGMRRITVSTCGIVPMIERFGDDFPQVNLAISLHAPNDELRRQMMPIANRFTIEELMDASDRYAEKTGRRVTYEYALVEGINDGDFEMQELANLLKGRLAHVNFIPVNKVGETGLKPTKMWRAREIVDEFESMGIAATLRKEMGSDIDGSCGQLRLSNQS